MKLIDCFKVYAVKITNRIQETDKMRISRGIVLPESIFDVFQSAIHSADRSINDGSRIGPCA